MTKQVTVNLENLSEDDRQRFWEIVEKANKPKAWKPKDGEWYYYVTSEGATTKSKWDNYNTDENRYTFCNCFRTVEEALFTTERLKVIAELEQFAKENNPPCFKNDNLTRKWIIVIRNSTGDVEPNWVISMYPCVTFATEEIAKAAIEKIGKDRLSKYYFGVTKE